MAGVDREPVGDIEDRVRVRAELLALGQPKRRPRVRLSPERGTRRAERSGHDQLVAGDRPGSARNPVRVPDRRDAEHDAACPRGIAADDGHPGLRDPLVELDDIFDLHVARCGERDEQALGVCSRRGEVAEVDRRRAPPEVAPRDPVEPKVDVLDERVLRDDHACVAELRGVVLDPLREATALEFGEQAELARLRELHRSPCAGRRHRGQPG